MNLGFFLKLYPFLYSIILVQFNYIRADLVRDLSIYCVYDLINVIEYGLRYLRLQFALKNVRQLFDSIIIIRVRIYEFEVYLLNIILYKRDVIKE